VKRLAFLPLAFVVLSAPALAHMPAVGTHSVMISHDKPSGTRGYGVEANAAVLILNFSLALRHWEKDVTAWNGRQLHNEATFYAGLGLLNVLQFQTGFSNAGRRSRVRADIVLGEEFPFAGGTEKWGRYSKGIVLSPFVETGSGRKVYGLGVGLALD
jgi:hypothetical protein